MPSITPALESGGVTLYAGDCLDVLRELPDCSVDSVVTDPPYGLANTDPAHVTETLLRWVNGERDYLPGGAGFMGKAWDAFVPPVAVWDDCLRVLKPGGHVLAFAGSRTVDLMTLGLRLAGFDIRDSIAWLYGSGFPKSLDVSKAIDKDNGRKFEDRFALGRHIRDRREALGLTTAEVNGWFGYRDGCQHWERQDRSGARVPSLKDWHVLRDRLGLSEEHFALVERAEAERAVIRRVKGAGARDPHSFGNGHSAEYDATAPATPDAERWQGWGTALKPAFEPVVVARKPLAGTVAANVLAHGTGALNIDACRIGYTSDTDKASARPGGKATSLTGALAGKAQTCEPTGTTEPPTPATTRKSSTSSTTGNAPIAPSSSTPRTEFQVRQGAGRWPANVVLDESQAAALDEQSGIQRDGVAVRRNGGGGAAPDHVYAGGWGSGGKDAGYGGSGGASRFFYVAKAPKSERPVVDGVVHPTVKPIALMRWLVRLVTPPGGTVLEPFAGSGTTVEAALLEGFNIVAIEREPDYLPLIEARIARAQAARAVEDDREPSLFDELGA